MIYVAIGSNQPGSWGSPQECVTSAIDRLDTGTQCRVLRQSPSYHTGGVGPGRPAPFVNAVVQIDTYLPPRALLSFLKNLERNAGTRSSMPWGPRSLDLDIIDYRGLIRGWDAYRPYITGYRAPGALVLPHPLAHVRPFVLQPLMDIAPQWWHPVFCVSASKLLDQVAPRAPGGILEKIA